MLARPVLRLLLEIHAGAPWRAAATTIDRALAGGLIVRNPDEAPAPWALTPAGMQAVQKKLTGPQ